MKSESSLIVTMPYLNTLSAAALSRAAAEKTHQGYTLYPGLVEAATVKKLLSHAQAATAWSNIFNDNKKRSVAAASPLGRNVAKAIHQFLTETACILDSFQHAKVLMQHKSKTASFLRSEAGCAEQPPHRDARPRAHLVPPPRARFADLPAGEIANAMIRTGNNDPKISLM